MARRMSMMPKAADPSSLGAICSLIERGNLDRKSKLESVGRICHELKSDPLLLDAFPIERLMKCMRRLVCDADSSTRLGALRVLRYTICSNDSVRTLIDLCLPIFVVRSMEREQKLLAERIQALKVIRRITEIDAAQMPPSLVSSIVAIASHKDDNLRRVCLETLRELALANIAIVATCNGVRVLVDSILDSSFQDLADSLLLTLLQLLNEPATRAFVDPFVDTQILLAPFTDTDLPAGNERRQRWMASRNAIVTMMRSWTGIVVLTSNPQGLQSLVQLLVRPVGDDVQKAVLSTICEIFYKKTSFDKNDASPANDVVSATIPISVSSSDALLLAPSGYNLLDNYTVIVLLAMIHCGLLDALITLGTGSNRTLAEPAIDLLADILRMSARLLPDQHCASLLALPRLVAATSTTTAATPALGDAVKSLLERLQREKSIRASEMLAELANAVGANSGSVATRGVSLVSYGGSGVNGVQLVSELLRDINRSSTLYLQYGRLTTAGNNGPTLSSAYTTRRPSGGTSSSGRDNLTSRELMVQELKHSMDAAMDDATFKDMLQNRSRILTDKNFTKWNWDVISEMLEGPLTNPQRLSEAMKTKFFKRLSGFFRGDTGNKGYFSLLDWIPDNVPFLRPACQMYTLLLNHPEGLLFLKTDRRGQLLTEISSALELEARPEAAIVESHIGALKQRMFSPVFCSTKMLREYFTLLGLMSSSKEGLKMMEQSNLFNRLNVMGTTKGHDFLCRLILANMDYSVDGSSRKLLQSWMASGSKALRLYATCLLRALLRSEVTDFAKWGVDALVTQLTQEEEVAKAALSVLDEATETEECLLAMVTRRPTKLLTMRDKRAESLLLRFLSLPEGLAFLQSTGDWIPRTLVAWRREKYISYVHAVENSLFRGLHRDVSGRERSSSTLANTASSSSLGSNGRRTCWPTPIPVQVPMKRGGTVKHSSSQRSLWGLDWLYKMPWNMEVKIAGPPGSGPPSNLTVEAYIDGSLRDEEDSALDEDDLRMNSIRVKAIVVDARNMPQPAVVNAQQTLQACLFLGTQPVDRRGFTKPPPKSNGGFVMPPSVMGTADAQNKGRSRSASTAQTGAPNDRSSETQAMHLISNTNDPSYPASESAAEEHKDWSTCPPDQRSAQFLTAPECSICAPGERAVWNFRVEMDPGAATPKRVLLQSVEFTLQLLPLRPRSVPLPPHLYGELGKTSAGCQILHASGHIPEFIACLRDSASVPLEKRAALWALGHIAATSRGYELIHHYAHDVLDVMTKLTIDAPLVSIRGTCFFVLGLIARSSAGRRHLSRLGWDAASQQNAAAQSSIAVPQNCNALFVWPQQQRRPSTLAASSVMSTVPSGWIGDKSLAAAGVVVTQHRQSPVTQVPQSPLQTLWATHAALVPAWKELLRLVADLSNHITQKEAHASLHKLRAAKPALFEEPLLALYVHALLEKYSYRLALRQFVLLAFDRAVFTDDVLATLSDSFRAATAATSGSSTSNTRNAPSSRLSTERRRSSATTLHSVTSSIQSLNAAIQHTGRLSIAPSGGMRTSSSNSSGYRTHPNGTGASSSLLHARSSSANSVLGAMGRSSSSSNDTRDSAARTTLTFRMHNNSHHEPLDRAVLLKRNRKRVAHSEKTIVVGAPEAVV